MSRAGRRLIEAAREAVAIARGERKPARAHIPSDINVKSIREKTKMPQEDFASRFGFSVNQIKDWEQGRSRPLGPLRVYLMLIDQDPKHMLEMIQTIKPKARKAA